MLYGQALATTVVSRLRKDVTLVLTSSQDLALERRDACARGCDVLVSRLLISLSMDAQGQNVGGASGRSAALHIRVAYGSSAASSSSHTSESFVA